MKKYLSLLLALVMVLSMMSFAHAEAGTFTGVGDGKNGAGSIEVEVDVDADGKLTDVRVTKNGDDAGISDPAVNTIPGLIVDLQSANIDVKTGATLTQGGIQMAVLDAVKKAGLDEAAFSELKAPEAQKSEDVDATYDVVVVGGGGAGLTASIRAAQAGAKVVLIEKTAALGGNTLIAGQGFNAADPERQHNQQMSDTLRKELESYLELKPEDFGEFGEVLTTVQGQIKEYLASGETYLFDTPELHMLHCYLGGTRTGLDGTKISPDLALVDVLTHSADAALDWAESIGVQWGDETHTILGAMWPRSHSLINGNIVPILEKAARDAGVEILLNTKGNSFIVEDGRVTGVNAETSDGAKVTLHASSGVVLATGGFSANAPMVVEYNNYWPGLSPTMPSTNAAGITGDGINMAKEIGADLVGMGYAQLMPSSHPVDGSLFSGIWGSAETQVFVNKEGKRYVNEYAERDVLSKAALDQTDGIFYIICDAKIANNPDRIASMEAAGNVVSANTLEELAEKLGIPVDAFIETINRYNTFVENQVDEDFGKPLFGEKIDTAPFVATPRSPSLHHTMGGVKIDPDTHVINTEGNIIPGLYAAGEVCGGIHAGNRLGGNAMTDFLVFGSIAGTNAATEAKAEAAPAEEAAPAAEAAPAGEVKTAGAQGFNSEVKVEATIADGKIVALTVDDSNETYPIPRENSVEKLIDAILAAGTIEGVDVNTGATFTSTAVVEALEKILSEEAAPADAAVAFTAGEYTATAAGYNGPVEVKVTFSADKLEAIEIVSDKETDHVGDVAFDIMIPEMIEAGGSGVDGVSGATFSSRALRNAVNDAAAQAGCANLDAFKSAKVEHAAGETIEDTWDVVIIGAGGAGLAAAAQAAQDGNTVLILEKAAEMGGNTLVSGGAFQSVMPYLVWDPADPEATVGINPIDGKEYAKVLNDAGRIETLKTILTWSEEPFDGTLDADHPFVAGDISLNAVRGVHEEYLPTLQALKKEINEYLAWAQPKLDAGEPETKITLFSTKNLHIFQTYYGGLRPNADGSEWVYGRFDLVSQVIEGGQDIKSWLVDQGAIFDYSRQSTLIGCLWQRENSPQGGVVDGVTYPSKWGSYFMVPFNTVKNANEHNLLMTRTTATDLITENGKIVGVKAEKFDGTKVVAHAAKGVIIATGGYGANIAQVQATNKYWKPEYIADNIGTTNRSALTGDGLTMAQAVGADIEGTGWTQMMPLGWVDNGNLSGGAGENVIFINAQTGERYVDESAERDVLSLGAFENSMNLDTAAKLGLKQVPGIYVEVSNIGTQAGPGGFNNEPQDVEGRMIFRTVEETAELIGCDPAALRKTIEDYDAYVMGQTDKLAVEKLSLRGTVGQVETDENGNYKPETYKLDKIRVRFMAPSTHHTMGGIKVDTDRRVINTEGNVIAGLYAAGEVTGGIHAGNRLGGNAVTEIIVSGRTAAKALAADAAAAPAQAAAPAEEASAAKGAFIPGTYEASAQGFGGEVKVIVTVDANAITAIEITGNDETPALGGAAMPAMAEAYPGKADAEAVDGMVGATVTSKAVKEAVSKALAQAKGEVTAVEENAAMTFTPGAYEATAAGYNGPTTVKVTFAEDKIEAIEIVSTAETGHVGDVAFDIMIPEMLEANGSGVDGVSGATFSSRALRTAVNDAAEQAGCTNLDAFKAAKVEHIAKEPMDLEYDVVVVGAGGAGIAAAAQAAQDGNTVLVIEKNAEVGGNTLVSGGQFQSVMPYLVWDPADPDATTGTYAFNGETYDKVKSVQGCINELKMILNWSEEPFDEEYYKTHEFVAGDALELSKHGVHAEYLPTLQALKAEIREYFVWAAPQLAAGKDESQLTLFSTINLHIFQTYYGGLRPSADGSEWIYGDIDLVKQFITGGQGLKEWLEAQGATFIENTQPTLIGALWYRENEFVGSTVDLDGDGNPEMGRWGSYFAAPMKTIYEANDQNKIMTRTTATGIMLDFEGRVIGVCGRMYDGTEVNAYAKKGVILATGGYAANTQMVVNENVYWSEEYLSTATKTTNRSSLQGDGIYMAMNAGGAVTGLGFTQLMPISWVDNGNLAFGGGNYACWINPTTGHRFVDEGSERDVLSLAEFRNGMEVNGTKGVFLEFYNKEQMMPAPMQLAEGDYEGRYYRRTIAELPELFKELGVTADPAVVIQTIRDYDAAVMGLGEYPDVGKAIASRTVGNVQKDENGKYLPDTYDLDNTVLTIRLMAPSTHHTMGGLVVDTSRHVLNAEGQIIPGLYAAGEVTGGIHGGNRLGGNAIVEIFVSGRTAAQAVTEDNK